MPEVEKSLTVMSRYSWDIEQGVFLAVTSTQNFLHIKTE